MERTRSSEFLLFYKKQGLVWSADRPRPLFKQINAVFGKSAWKVIKRYTVLTRFCVNVRAACKHWSVLVRFKTQKRSTVANRECCTSEDFSVQIERARLSFGDVYWWRNTSYWSIFIFFETCVLTVRRRCAVLDAEESKKRKSQRFHVCKYFRASRPRAFELWRRMLTKNCRLSILFYVYVRPACRHWGGVVQFRMQERSRNANRKCYSSKCLGV